MDQSDELATSDLTLAAVLLVNGFRPLAVEPDPADPLRRKRFVLAGDAALYARLSRELLLDDVLVPARAFGLAQRRLKRLLYEGTPASHPRSMPPGRRAT